MSDTPSLEAAAERPTVRISFRWLMAILLALAGVAGLGGRYVYANYAMYRPLALMHVPTEMRYRARVEVRDQKRMAAIEPLLRALDPKGTRLPALEQKLGSSGKAVLHEVAFGSGTAAGPSDFVVVLGLQLQAQAGLATARAVCDVLNDEGRSVERASEGCRFDGEGLVAGTPDGALVISSRAALVQHLLRRPDIGDRMGFGGPSVRGASPETGELGREASALTATLLKRFP